MAEKLSAEKYEIDVIFDVAKAMTGADPFSYAGDVNGSGKDFRLKIRQNLAWIDFNLKVVNGFGSELVGFTTNVFQWLSPGKKPIPTPIHSFNAQRHGDDLATLINTNRVAVKGDEVDFNFEIGVVLQGKTFTSPDPTIINVDPTGGGGNVVVETGLREEEVSALS
jgi:hypothetical protein